MRFVVPEESRTTFRPIQGKATRTMAGKTSGIGWELVQMSGAGTSDLSSKHVSLFTGLGSDLPQSGAGTAVQARDHLTSRRSLTQLIGTLAGSDGAIGWAPSLR